ncbi:MAG: ABC transporter permease [Solirubrobacterales bacterium]
MSDGASSTEPQMVPSQATASSPAVQIEPELRVFVPVRRRVQLREFWTSLRVGRMLGIRDVKSKYKQSALGPIWLLVQPLVMLIAIVAAFSAVANVDTGHVPYVVFALVGLAVWMYFQAALTTATITLPNNATLVRRSPCPRVALITGTLLSVVPPLAVLLPIALVAAAVTGGVPTQELLLPVMIAWLLALTTGVTLLVGALGARFRDMAALAPLVLQAGIFLTPVGYPLSASHAYSAVIALNPVSGLLEGWRWAVLDVAPDLFAVAVGVAWTVIVGYLGWYVFGRQETRFADYV